jgi:hypothetical protein
MSITFDKPLRKILIRVYEDDYEYIMDMAAASDGDISANLILRNIIANYVKGLREIERSKIDEKRTASKEETAE